MALTDIMKNIADAIDGGVMVGSKAMKGTIVLTLFAIILGVFANSVTDGSITMSTDSQSLVNNTSGFGAGFLSSVLTGLNVAKPFILLAVIIVIFGFIIYNDYNKNKGGGNMGDVLMG
ncbi:MAG: hypothetical protein ACFFDN_01410 [Candidatus Hodarchaeota archaeon]